MLLVMSRTYLFCGTWRLKVFLLKLGTKQHTQNRNVIAGRQKINFKPGTCQKRFFLYKKFIIELILSTTLKDSYAVLFLYFFSVIFVLPLAVNKTDLGLSSPKNIVFLSTTQLYQPISSKFILRASS